MSAPKFGEEMALGHLASIDASLKELVALSKQRLARAAAPQRAENSERVASDSDLDSQYGDPEIKMNKMPRDWTGPNMKGRKMSQCPSAFLELAAGFFDWAADKAEEKNETYGSQNKPVAPLRRKDAALARGWALRNQNKPEQAQSADDGFGKPEPF